MTDCAMCGDCCENFPLNTPQRADVWGRMILANVARAGTARYEGTGVGRKQAAWMGELEVVSGPHPFKSTDKDGNPTTEMRYRYRCPRFDPVARVCSDHANRPPVCSRYPWYDREVEAGDYRSLPARCSFVADDPSVKLLPIVEVSGGHSNRGAEDARHSDESGDRVRA